MPEKGFFVFFPSSIPDLPGTRAFVTRAFLPNSKIKKYQISNKER